MLYCSVFVVVYCCLLKLWLLLLLVLAVACRHQRFWFVGVRLMFMPHRAACALLFLWALGWRRTAYRSLPCGLWDSSGRNYCICRNMEPCTLNGRFYSLVEAKTSHCVRHARRAVDTRMPHKYMWHTQMHATEWKSEHSPRLKSLFGSRGGLFCLLLPAPCPPDLTAPGEGQHAGLFEGLCGRRRRRDMRTG